MVLQWSQQTVVGPHRIAIYKSVKKHSATEQMSQTRAQLVKGFSNTSASADVITVDSSANVGINKTSPVKDLDVTGEIRASTGILFGTDTAAANTLDDYEEGTWTPDIEGSTTAGTYTYNGGRSGHYTKIGNRVFIRASMLNIATDVVGAGTLRIVGLPFQNTGGYTTGNVYLANFNVDDATVNLVSRVEPSSTYMIINETRDNASGSTVSITDKTSNSADIIISISYMAS